MRYTHNNAGTLAVPEESRCRATSIQSRYIGNGCQLNRPAAKSVMAPGPLFWCIGHGACSRKGIKAIEFGARHRYVKLDLRMPSLHLAGIQNHSN